MSTTFMKCGHTAQGLDSNDKPVCITCIGLRPGAREVEDNLPDLTGRMAHCSYGMHAPVPSSFDLAFFEYQPNADYDRYYCGCWGWD